MHHRFAIYALTPQGAELAGKIVAHTGGAVFLADGLRALPASLGASGGRFFDRLGEALAENFPAFSCHVLICASGIAVRALAPLLRDKSLDPAILLLDQQGRFVISLLAGHLGGANRLARELAARLGATPVITTGTDVDGIPAVDDLAQAAGLRILNLGAVRAVNAALLRGEKPTLFDPGNLLRLAGTELETFFAPAAGAAEAAIIVGLCPPGLLKTGVLHLAGKDLWLGLGCRRGVKADDLYAFTRRELAEAGFALRDLAGLASLELKRDEAGLLALAEELLLPLRFFSAAELDAVTVPSPSGRVKSLTGTSSVCEAAALLAASLEAGKERRPALLLSKRQGCGMTLALAGLESDRA